MPPPPDRARSAVQLVVGLLRPHRRAIALAATLTLLGCLLTLGVPLLVQHLVNHVTGRSSPSLPLAAGLLAGAVVVRAVVALAATIIMGRVAIDMVRQLRRDIYERLLRADATAAPGVVLSRLTDDVAAVQNLVSVQTVGVLTDLGTAVVVAGWLLVQTPALFLVVLLITPFAVLHFRHHAPRIRAGAEDVRDRLDGIFVQLKEKIDAAAVVKGHGREDAEALAFEARIEEAHAPRIQLGRLSNGFTVGGQFLAAAGAAVVFLAGVAGVIAGHLHTGEVVAASAMTALLFGPLGRLSDVANLYEQAVASGSRLARLTELPSVIVTNPVQPIPIGRATGRIEFDMVGASYEPGHPVLNTVRLRIEPGERVALVGPSGCGKSTLLALLLRFRDPCWGDIRLDGISLRSLKLADLRRQIGVVPQDPVVFRGTLADNIRYGCPDAGMDRVHDAAQVAGLEALVKRLPQSYETVIGEGGHPLSSGEVQRIAIARAVCLDPAIVLLDEATSSLDPLAEAELQTALDRLLRGRTAIVVAHRPATVRGADRIVVIEGGRIVQSGPHAELILDTAGLYHRFASHRTNVAAATAAA